MEYFGSNRVGFDDLYKHRRLKGPNRNLFFSSQFFLSHPIDTNRESVGEITKYRHRVTEKKVFSKNTNESIRSSIQG